MDGLNMALALPYGRPNISLLFETHPGLLFETLERAENLVSESGAMSVCKIITGERGAKNMPFPLRSHALVHMHLVILMIHMWHVNS